MSVCQIWAACAIASTATSLAKSVILHQHSTLAFSHLPLAFVASNKSRRGKSSYSSVPTIGEVPRSKPRRRIEMEAAANDATSPLPKSPQKRLFIAVEVIEGQNHDEKLFCVCKEFFCHGEAFASYLSRDHALGFTFRYAIVSMSCTVRGHEGPSPTSQTRSTVAALVT
jgi:hypothetical protein